jgi:hypothetical protein
MTYRNDFARCIAENIEDGDKAYAHRIECWEKHIRFTVEQAIAAGFSIGVNDGEETVLTDCRDVETIMKALFSTDEDYLLLYESGNSDHFGWIWLVYGNGVDEVISDYTMNLEKLFMNAVNEFADTLI